MDSFNTNFGGRYIFSVRIATTKPFSGRVDNNGDFSIEYAGTTCGNANISKEISRGVNVELKTDGNRLFQLENRNSNIGDLFNKIYKALDSEDGDGLGELLGDIDSQIDNTVNTRTDIGAIQNRLTAALDRNDSEHLNLESSLSTNQDIDLAETYMNYTMEKTAYQASLSMGTKILQTNIMDYVR